MTHRRAENNRVSALHFTCRNTFALFFVLGETLPWKESLPPFLQPIHQCRPQMARGRLLSKLGLSQILDIVSVEPLVAYCASGVRVPTKKLMVLMLIAMQGKHCRLHSVSLDFHHVLMAIRKLDCCLHGPIIIHLPFVCQISRSGAGSVRHIMAVPPDRM